MRLQMSPGEALRLSSTGVSNDYGQKVQVWHSARLPRVVCIITFEKSVSVYLCRCWVAPAVHMLVKNPVLSDFLVEKLVHSASSEVQSQILVLMEKFLRHSEAVDLEAHNCSVVLRHSRELQDRLLQCVGETFPPAPGSVTATISNSGNTAKGARSR